MMPRCILHGHTPSHECIIHREPAHDVVVVDPDSDVTSRHKILYRPLTPTIVADSRVYRTQCTVYSSVYRTPGGVPA